MAFENDPEGYRMAQMYGGRDFDKRQTKQMETFCSYGGEWSLEEFKSVIDDAINKIPPEYREKATVELEDVGYQESCIKFVVRYTGLEPQEVVDDRIRRCEEYVGNSRAKELKQYDSLKLKFGA